MYWTFRTLIVPVSLVDMVNMLCSSLAGVAGEGMFTTPVSPSGSSPATHYISAGLIEESFSDILPLAEISEGNADAIAFLASEKGIVIDVSEIESLLGSVYVSDKDAFSCLDILGLKLCSEDI